MASPAASYNMPMRDPPVLGQCGHALAGISKCRCGCHASYASNRSAHATCRVRLEDLAAAGTCRGGVRRGGDHGGARPQDPLHGAEGALLAHKGSVPRPARSLSSKICEGERNAKVVNSSGKPRLKWAS